MPVYSLASLTWTAVRELPAARTVAVLPAGAIEAHGPHLPLATDVIIAEAMARAGADRLAARGLHVLLLPALTIAPAPFAAEFPGTLDVPPEATTMIVGAVMQNLAAHGCRAAAIANAHHDPAHVAALRRAVGELNAHGPANRRRQGYGGSPERSAKAEDGHYAEPAGMVAVFPDLTRRRWAERLTAEFRSGACHAGRYETSIVLAERPDLVRTDVMSTLAPNPRSLVDAIREGRTTFTAAGGSDAYFGCPAEATAEEGRAIIETLGAILAEAVVEAIDPTGVAS